MNQVFAEIITIGDEILYGQTLDTNAHWISGELDKVGIKVIRRTTVGDQEADIIRALEAAESMANIILITGGLGPTSDDLTKPCLARYFDSPMAMNPQALAELEQFMRSRGRNLNESTRRQAILPIKCTPISNPRGTATGLWFNRNGKVFVAMPGVPHEMRDMITASIIPRLKEKFDLPVIFHKIVRVVGIGESWLSEKISDWEQALPKNMKLAYLPTFGDIKLRITAFGQNIENIKIEVEKQRSSLVSLIQEYVYGYDDDTLESVAGNLLRQKGQKLALAESCTGGYIAHLITSVPGSSDYFNGGVVPYQNAMKIEQLGVSEETLSKFGAVSENTVMEMATRVREKFKADYGMATSGIAGPGGGTPEKPVGLVWMAVSDKNTCKTQKLQLIKDRMVNIQLTSVAALNFLRQRLLEND